VSSVVEPCTAATSPQYLGRKTLPIKRADAEPLTREDLQYDLLYFIFADPTQAFVDSMAPGKPLVNFCDLYVNALFNSNKCSKVLKDKMVDTPEFAIEFAKIALLTNVGRINTTMACEWKSFSLLPQVHSADQRDDPFQSFLK
jgi:Ino eighty subunit 1